MRDTHAVINGSYPGNAVLSTGQTTPIYPVKNATTPYWRSQLHPIDERRTTPSLPTECDIAIIGAGMAGASMAYHLTQKANLESMGDNKTPSIVILEARQVCSGATGRNGGHIKVRTPLLWRTIHEHGEDAGEEKFAFVQEQIYALKEIVEKEGLECEFEIRRSFDVFLDEDEAREVEKKWKQGLREGRRWTKDVDWIGKDFVKQITSLHHAIAALSTPSCSLWPYKFVSQLLARLEERGLINLQTNTVVKSISTPEGGKNVLHTSRGDVLAKKVIFASNGYTGGLSATYAGNIVPVRITASHLKPSKPVAPHLTHTYNIAFAPNKVDYLNPRPDGSIVVGGAQWTYQGPEGSDRSHWFGNWDDSVLLEPARGHFDTLMQRNFRGWEGSGSKLESLWTGIIGYTPDSLPHVGIVPGQEGRQWILAGFNGGGMPDIFLCARGVAQMVLEDVPFDKTGVPRLFETSKDRLEKAHYLNSPEQRS